MSSKKSRNCEDYNVFVSGNGYAWLVYLIFGFFCISELMRGIVPSTFSRVLWLGLIVRVSFLFFFRKNNS